MALSCITHMPSPYSRKLTWDADRLRDMDHHVRNIYVAFLGSEMLSVIYVTCMSRERKGRLNSD